MRDYPWVCHACKAANDPAEVACRDCGCPAEATGQQIQEAVTGIKAPPLSHQELQRQRRAELAALPPWKKPLGYGLRLVQFAGSLVFGLGILDLALLPAIGGLALVIGAEAVFRLLQGSEGRPALSHPPTPSA